MRPAPGVTGVFNGIEPLVDVEDCAESGVASDALQRIAVERETGRGRRLEVARKDLLEPRPDRAGEAIEEEDLRREDPENDNRQNGGDEDQGAGFRMPDPETAVPHREHDEKSDERPGRHREQKREDREDEDADLDLVCRAEKQDRDRNEQEGRGVVREADPGEDRVLIEPGAQPDHAGDDLHRHEE